MRFIIILLTIPALGAHPYDSVCRVNGGSGALIATDDIRGLVVTNAHVIENSNKIYWPVVKKSYMAYLTMIDWESDIAFLVCKKPALKPIGIDRSKKTIVATGFPYYDRNHLHWQQGDIVKDDIQWISWNKKPVPGMSGGACFNLNGDLIGIVRGYNDYGVAVSWTPLLLKYIKFRKPKTWQPIDFVPRKCNFAVPDGKIRTKRYNEKTAPELK